MAAAIRYTGLTVAAGDVGVNFRITPLAFPMRPLIATQIGKTRDSLTENSTMSAAMPQSLADQPIYPSNRAFVLQFHREADLKAGRCLGRIEQVISGKVGHFQSPEELLAFLTERLDEETDRIDPS